MGITEKLNPRADKKILILIAGIMWCGVGVMLMSFAATWLGRYEGKGLLFYYAAGFIAAMPIHHFGNWRIKTFHVCFLLKKKGVCFHSLPGKATWLLWL
jgi:hypothetical protein